MTEPQLKRSISLPLLVFYGLGTIVGAGIYLLVGKVSSEAGTATAYAFLLSGLVASFSALSHGELAARLPRSAGASVYVDRAFRRRWLAGLVGWAVVATGIVSSAAMVRGSVGYLDVFITLPPALVMGIFTLLLVGIAIWGMKESALLITLITLLEVGGLIVAIYISSDLAPVLSWSEILMPPIDTGAWLGISIGAYLAFYAFIGFEDMVTVAEEVTDVERAMPRAIIIVMVLATVLYVGVGIAALRVMPVADLAASSAPFADLISRAGQSPVFITLISLIAIINGALVQIIMASRMLYGMGQEALAPKFLSVVHHKRQTPHVASLMAGVVVLAFALFLPLVTLAKLTSSIILMVFTLVNLALVRLRLRDGVPDDAFNLPLLVPIIGALLSLTLFLWPFIGEVVGVGH